MLKRLKRYWSSLKEGRPGARFQEQYEHERRKQKGRVGRVLRIAAGVLLVPVGLFFLAVPGPGLIIIGLGAVLIAREFHFAAIVLDWLEVRGRKVFKWAKQRWQRLIRARRAVIR
jgi:uncharacterized protein (TIGR02611 family)